MWEALGQWLDRRKELAKNSSPREWLQRWDGCALILAGVPHAPGPVGLMFGRTEWCDNLRQAHGNVSWLGESVNRTGKSGAPKRDLYLPV